MQPNPDISSQKETIDSRRYMYNYSTLYNNPMVLMCCIVHRGKLLFSNWYEERIVI